MVVDLRKGSKNTYEIADALFPSSVLPVSVATESVSERND